MNRLLFNRSFLNTNSLKIVKTSPLTQNYSVKSISPPLRNIAKESPRIVFHPIICPFSSHFSKQFCRKNASYAPLNINTKNLTKDVIVFKYNNPRYFKIMNFFGIVQFFFWIIFAEFTLSTLRNTPIDENDPNFDDLPFHMRINLGENKYKYGLAITSFMIGKFDVLLFEVINWK